MGKNKNVRVGIVGVEEDDHVQALSACLEEKGAAPQVLDFVRFPQHHKLTVAGEQIFYDSLDLLQMDGFFIRQAGYMWPMPQKVHSRDEWTALHQDYLEFIANERETLSLVYSILGILDRRFPLVNPQQSFTYHAMKPLQFYLLERHQIASAPFVAGNSYEHIRDFITGLEEKTVVKPLAGGAEVVAGDLKFLEENRQKLRQKPFIFQRNVHGLSLRAYVLGEEVIACGEIIHGPQLDWRVDQKGVKPFTPPADVSEMAVKAVHLLGMRFAAVDIEREERSGTHYILDINPAPFFLGFEAHTGEPITSRLADYLIRLGRES